MNLFPVQSGRLLPAFLAALLLVGGSVSVTQAQGIITPGPNGVSYYRPICTFQPSSKADILLSTSSDEFFQQRITVAADGAAITISQEQRQAGNLLSMQRLQADFSRNNLVLMKYTVDPTRRSRLSTQCLSRELQPGEWMIYLQSLSVQFNFARTSAALNGSLTDEQTKAVNVAHTKLAAFYPLRSSSFAREQTGALHSSLLIVGDQKAPVYLLAPAGFFPMYSWNPTSGVVTVFDGQTFRHVGKKTAQQQVEYLEILGKMHALASRGAQLSVVDPKHNAAYIELVFRIVGEFISI